MAAVTFTYADWIAAYPQFAGVAAPLAQTYFDMAGLYQPNEETNVYFALVSPPGTMLKSLLWLLTAHLAWLNAPRDDNGNPSSTGTKPPPAVVGRINSASEGSVSVQAEWKGDDGNPSASWYLQTPWGAQYWTLTSVQRMGRYYANPTVVYGGAYPLISTYRGR